MRLSRCEFLLIFFLKIKCDFLNENVKFWPCVSSQNESFNATIKPPHATFHNGSFDKNKTLEFHLVIKQKLHNF